VGVLSPYLFACFIDSMVDKVKLSGVGCYVNMACMSLFLYADDILLVVPSVSSLQRILRLCEAELEWLDIRVSTKKSSCIRFGPRFNVKCNSISMIDEVKCLGVTALDIWVSISGPQERLPTPLVMGNNPCVGLSTQLLAKLGELHLLML